MQEIDLSIIIPVYNTEKYFSSCIESVLLALKKTKIRYEIIVIDDGSKGNIKEIIKKYLKDHSELIFLSQENKGRGATRNLGISIAKGKYLSFIDSDDFIDENFYIKMFEKIKKENLDIVICDIENIDYEKKENNFVVEAKNNEIKDDKICLLDVMIAASCCNKIIKKALFNDLKFPENINYEDLATIPVILQKASKIGYIDKPLYKYVQNEDSVMHEEFSISQLKLIDALEIICDRIYEIKDISLDDKNKLIYMICTRRYYEELLEKIMLSKDKDKLVVEFCKKVKKLEAILYNNIYLKKLICSQGLNKKIGNKLLHFAIKNNKSRLVSIFLSKRIYYRFLAIKYKSM